MLRLALALLAAFSLIAVNGVLVAVEFACARVRRTRLEELSGEGIRAARHAILVVDHLSEYLATTQIGITAASLGVGWLGEDSFARLLQLAFSAARVPASIIHGFALALAFLLVTTMHVVFGELVPKNLAVVRAEHILVTLAPPLELLHRMLRPLRHSFVVLADGALRLLGHRRMPPPALSEEELKLVVEDSHAEGVVTDSEAKIIVRAFEFADRAALEIMTPAGQVDFLSLARSFDENVAAARKNMHARLPLCRTDLDSVLGIVSMRDVWSVLLTEQDNDVFERAARPAVHIPDEMAQDGVLRMLQDAHCKMGIVRDRADRKSLGVVTLDDVLEALVGNIREAPTTIRR
jgi:magnesium and cobalt exporter, CNNM family